MTLKKFKTVLVAVSQRRYRQQDVIGHGAEGVDGDKEQLTTYVK